jgi:hypothetical protein
MHQVKPPEVQIAAIHDVERSGFQDQNVEHIDIAPLAVRDVNGAGMLPRRSSSVCIFTADLVVRNNAHGKSDRHRSMAVESSAYAVLSNSTPKLSPA